MTRPLIAEALGAAMLLISVVGSGIMGAALAGGNIAMALLANAIATGCMLYVIITLFGPLSGAHFNPAVTFYFALRREIAPRLAFAYVAAQIIGGILGVWLTHVMFDLDLLQVSSTAHRFGPAQWVSEALATLGLLLVIVGGSRTRPGAIPALVALYITGAYWFTASTSFANPAVTIARSLTDTFAGILPAHAPAFVLVQILSASLAALLLPRLFR